MYTITWQIILKTIIRKSIQNIFNHSKIRIDLAMLSLIANIINKIIE